MKHRPLKLLVAIVAVASVGAGCSSGGGVSSSLNDAATMRYTVKGKHHTLHVSRARLLSEVGSLVNNKPFVAFLKEQKFEINKDLTADSRLTAIWLTQLIQQETIDSLFDSRHLHVTAAQRQQAAKDAPGFFPDKTMFPAFNKEFRDTLIERQARSLAVAASYADTSDTAGKAYFTAHQSEFGCASGKNVAHILVKTQAEAQAIVDQLATGGSFATIAKEKSTDPGSAQKGGELGCLAAGEFVAPFQTAAQAATVGTPTAPVHTQFGFHIILVTKATAASYESAHDQVVAALKQQGSQNFSNAVNGLFKAFKVHVDPRFGTWGHTPNAQGQLIYQVTAPKAPTPATSRDGSTTTTVPAAANGSP
jgi:hypothetical protein